MKRLGLVMALLLAGCLPPGKTALPPVGADLVAAQQAACEKKGGTFGPIGKSGALTCFTTPRDAGKSCRVGSDCEAGCLARSMSCAPIKPLAGCNEIINDLGQRFTQCVE